MWQHARDPQMPGQGSPTTKAPLERSGHAGGSPSSRGLRAAPGGCRHGGEAAHVYGRTQSSYSLPSVYQAGATSVPCSEPLRRGSHSDHVPTSLHHANTHGFQTHGVNSRESEDVGNVGDAERSFVVSRKSKTATKKTLKNYIHNVHVHYRCVYDNKGLCRDIDTTTP